MTSRPLVLAIFLLSGAAASIDEIVWSRQLVLVFGNTTQDGPLITDDRPRPEYFLLRRLYGFGS